MANPQAENGHLDIANELAEALARTYLSPTESRVLWAVLRKTYGWEKKTDRISFTQFEKATGMNRRHVFDALNSLIARRIITRSGEGQQLFYGLQKDYERWQPLPAGATARHGNLALKAKPLPVEVTEQTVTRKGNTSLPAEATESLPVEAKTIDNTNTYLKKESIGAQNIKLFQSTEVLEYIEKLKPQFPGLNFDLEMQGCRTYWSEDKRKLQRPKSAVLRWMKNAQRYKQGKSKFSHSRVLDLPKVEQLKQGWNGGKG